MTSANASLRLAAASIACAILAGASLPSGVRAVGAVPLLLYLPGRCWLAASLPRKASGSEAQVLSIALSLALTVLLGLLLAGTGLLGQAGWMAGPLAICLTACAVSFVTRPRPDTTIQTKVIPPVGALHLGAVVLGAGLAVFAVAEASSGALRQRPDLYTDFWIVPQDGAVPSLATVGLRNAEGTDTTYAIDVLARGLMVDRGVPFTLSDGAERTLTVALPSFAFAEPEPRSPWATADASATRLSNADYERDRVELRLFKDGDRTSIYRRVWVALPTPIAPKPEVVAGDAPAGDLSDTGSVTNTMRAQIAVRHPGQTGATTPPEMGAILRAPPADATLSFIQSETAAWKSPQGIDATQALRAASAPDVMPGLKASRFTPQATLPVDPTPLQPE